MKRLLIHLPVWPALLALQLTVTGFAALDAQQASTKAVSRVATNCYAAQKLIQADAVLKAYASADRVRVMVLLVNPAETNNPKWSDRASLNRVHTAVEQHQDRVLSR